MMARSDMNSLANPMGQAASTEVIQDGSRSIDAYTADLAADLQGVDTTPAYYGALRPSAETIPPLDDGQFAAGALGKSLL
jgi:hypothetical protein